jgi:hypothetical protein
MSKSLLCPICLSNKPGQLFPYLGKGTCYPNHLLCTECMNKSKPLVCPICRAEKIEANPPKNNNNREPNIIIFDDWITFFQDRNNLTLLMRIYVLGYVLSVLSIGMYWSFTNLLVTSTLFRAFWGFLLGILVGSIFSLLWPILWLSLVLYILHSVIPTSTEILILKSMLNCTNVTT